MRLVVSALLVVGLVPAAAFAQDDAYPVGLSEQTKAQEAVVEDTPGQAEQSEVVPLPAVADDQAASNAVTLADASASTGTYDLYWYALIPGETMDSDKSPDETWYGIGVSSISGVSDPASLATGTAVTSYGSIATKGGKKDLFPDITYNRVTYKYAESGSENASKQGYYTLSPARIRVSDGANAGQNAYNTTVDSGTHTYHYDNIIVLNEKDIFSVNFMVKNPGETEWETLSNYAQRVKSGYAESNIKKPTETDVPQTKVVDGISYRFDGWYTDPECTQKASFDGTITHNTVYYACYKPEVGNLSLSKTVSGSAANVQDSFTFELTCATLAGKQVGVAESGAGLPTVVTFDANGVATVQLKHGQTITLTDLPAGAQVSVRETGLSGNAKTSSSVSVNNGAAQVVAHDGDTATAPVTATVVKDATQTIAFTNSADAVSATGVSVDALPMAALLAVAGAGAGALCACRGRKKREMHAWKE